MKKLFAIFTLGIFFLISCAGTKDLQGSFSSAKGGGTPVGPNLTITANKSVQNKKVYEYGETVVALAMDFKCQSSTDCSVSQISFQGYLDDDGDASSFATDSSSTTHGSTLDHVTTMYLYDSATGGTKLGTVSYSSSTPFTRTFSSTTSPLGTVSYSSSTPFSSTTSPIVISANTTKTIYLTKASVNLGTQFSDGDAENIAFGIAAASDVTAVDGSGTALSVNIGPNGLNTAPAFYFSLSYGVVLSNGSVGVGGTTAIANDVKLLAMNVECKSPGACVFNSGTGLIIHGYIDDNGGRDALDLEPSSSSGKHGSVLSTYINNIRIENDGGIVLTGPVSFESDGYTLNFGSFTVPAASTKTLYLIGDIYNAYADGDAEDFYFKVTTASVSNKLGTGMYDKGSPEANIITTSS